MKIVGGRKYSFTDDHGISQSAKLYFVKTDDRGLCKLRSTLVSGDRDTVKEWRKQISTIHSFDLLTAGERVMGFPEGWDAGSVEFVLHPIDDEIDKILELFFYVSQIPPHNAKIKKYEKGLTFISAKCSLDSIERLEKMNPLRAVHPLGTISIVPIRSSIEEDAPQPPSRKECSTIKVGVFDGGADETLPLLKGFVNSVECVPSKPIAEYSAHGTGVCGAVLYGNLAGKGRDDILATPSVSVESFRVLPLQDNDDFELYEAIDAIESIVTGHRQIKLFNLSFGPAGAIVDDSISRFTYAIDRLSYDVGENESNPLFCVAVGNDGQLSKPLNRIQSPSDIVNGLGIGAYTICVNGSKKRAEYSCTGAGREGAKTKPELLEFGGSLDRPFVLVGSKPNALAASAGTSFASPLAVHKIGQLMALSQNIVPHLGRTLLIHNAETISDCSMEEQGFGICPDNAEDILLCEDTRVTILYAGVLEPTQIVRLPVFSPKINKVKGNVTVKWTITTIVDPYMNDPDAYTNNCIEDTFVPHEMVYWFRKQGETPIKLNLLDDHSILTAERLLDSGYSKSDFPASQPAKKYWAEKDLRSCELKWDTVIKKYQRMRGSSLLNPVITLHAMGRNGFQNHSFRYFAVVSIEAPNFTGSLYDAILQTYRNLTPIEIRNANRIMISMN